MESGTLAERQFLANYWWVLTLRGVVTLLFGMAAVFWPGLTLITLLYLFSTFLLISGVIEMVQGIISIGRKQGWFLTLLLGFFELGVGVYLLRHPQVTFATFILLIGFTLIVRGVIEAVGAFTDPSAAHHRIMTIIGGGLALLAGTVVLFQPAASGVAFVWILGLYALIAGPILIALSLEVHKALQASHS